MSELLPMVDRAVQLAQSGECHSVNEVRQRLRREGYQGIGIELAGAEINRQLVDLIRAVARR
jgi:hypothetical protein